MHVKQLLEVSTSTLYSTSTHTQSWAYQLSVSSSSKDWVLAEVHCRHHMLPCEPLHQAHPDLHYSITWQKLITTRHHSRTSPVLAFSRLSEEGRSQEEGGHSFRGNGVVWQREHGCPTDQEGLKQEGATSEKSKWERERTSSGGFINSYRILLARTKPRETPGYTILAVVTEEVRLYQCKLCIRTTALRYQPLVSYGRHIKNSVNILKLLIKVKIEHVKWY